MNTRDWCVIIGFVFVISLLCYIMYYEIFLDRATNSNNSNKRNNNITPNVYSQSWLQNFLRWHPIDCLRYLPNFRGQTWNDPSATQFNNCYAYAFRNLDLNRTHKPQPGELSKRPEVPKHKYSCENIFQNVIHDHPGTYRWDSKAPCPCGSYKGFLVLSQSPPDYHFLREDANGLWSHKLGSGAATQYDASNQLITDPLTANLDYGEYNYKKRCFSFCTPYNSSETNS